MSAPEITILRRAGAPRGDVPRHRNGYALVIRCFLGHSGNTRFAHHSGTSWECQGCGHFIRGATLADRQRDAIAHADAEVQP